MKNDLLLGVNIDHVATLRQARGTRYPDPVYAAMAAEKAGADGITLHLREDLRHIQPRDVKLIKDVLQTRMNFEMAVTEPMLQFAEALQPEHACFVPEKREELTTEGGLDVITHHKSIAEGVKRLQAQGIDVSLFIDPDIEQIVAAKATGATTIELHTGCYADALTNNDREQELERIKLAAQHAAQLNLLVNAGHGLNYHNVKPIASIAQLHELNIGHAIIAHALFAGFEQAVVEMKRLMLDARANMA